jgi:gamma-D-glutamyl-L-lysine dipeptidyl-peptidase
MEYGICLLSIVPCRKEPSSTSEMVTQLLFGEHYWVTEISDDWLKIKIAFDDYPCWISKKQHFKLSEQAFSRFKNLLPIYSGELVQVINDLQAQSSFPITIGAVLPFLSNKLMRFDQFEFSFEGLSTSTSTKKSTTDIIATAFLFLNAPYLWGGKSPFGIDCSGFTQLVYKINGHHLLRDAGQQVTSGTALSFVEEAEAGDLAFFDNEEGNIVHVGILLNNKQIIHASGKVRIDDFDHYGIFNVETRKYSHTLRVIKRL